MRDYFDILKFTWNTLPKSLVLCFIVLNVLAALMSMIIPEKIHGLIVESNDLSSDNVLNRVVQTLVVMFMFGLLMLCKNAIAACVMTYGERLFSESSLKLSKNQSVKGTGLEQFNRIREAYVWVLSDTVQIVFGAFFQFGLAIYFLGTIISIKISLLASAAILSVVIYSFFSRKLQRTNRSQWNSMLTRETDYSYKILKRKTFNQRDNNAYQFVGTSLLRNLRNNFFITLPISVLMFICLAAGYYLSFQSGGVAAVILWQLYFGMLLAPLSTFSEDIENIIHCVTDIVVATKS